MIKIVVFNSVPEFYKLIHCHKCMWHNWINMWAVIQYNSKLMV